MSAGELHSDAILADDRNLNHAGESILRGAFRRFVDLLFNLASISLIVASGVLTVGVLLSHFTGQGMVWQDEMEVFLVAGAVFLSAAAVQARRGHIGIELLASFLPRRAKVARDVFIDTVSLIFIAFVAWKAGELFHEAWAEGQISQSSWGAPLWIPYLVMTVGFAVLALQLALQVGERSIIMLVLGLAAFAALVLWQRPVMPLLQGYSPATIGIAYCSATLLIMFSGIPIAFALGVVATIFMFLFMPRASVDTIAQNVYEELANVILLAIPLFILKGAAIGRSDAGKDLYSALHAWLHKVPGGLGVANTLACGLFAAMAGSSPATCSAIGSAGIPEMRKRGYSPGLAAGIIAAGGTLGILLPPSVTMLLYAVAAEVSLGKLFLAGIGPGLLLIVLFALYASWKFSREKRQALAAVERGQAAQNAAILHVDHYTLRQKITMVAWVMPFVTILAGVMVVLYAGYATPSETAGVGAILALLVIGVMYGVWRPKRLMPILTGTMRESSMLLLIIGFSLLFSYVMSYLHISQSAAMWLTSLGLSRWELLASILVFVVVLGFFLPPVSIILMTAPIILPPLRAAGFDLIWFGVVMTIVMEMGLIHPPVGLNLFVIKNIAPDIPLSTVMWGALPFVFLMFVGVVLICFFPQIAMFLPSFVS
ncbi:TRAP dicarboxylate transporter, DctM subunit [Rhodomicrobium vannielii ATCC 17100]|uniref:TRAP dicarboxylate transporter, DctM subunit n=2 Tax=Rhodomicrobium vannielii TaxID=1069 RepID=E3I252_RHOVT|nr:TRAP dicarboxylate transporter, DctM subunit [Rhodomicrobium vannielii ATCC 17100]